MSKIQDSLINRVGVIVVLVGVALLITWLAWPKVEYLPTGNRNLVFGIIMPPPGYNLGELGRVGELVEQELRPYWDVDSNSSIVGDNKYPPIADFFYVARRPAGLRGTSLGRSHSCRQAGAFDPGTSRPFARLHCRGESVQFVRTRPGCQSKH